ncbi:MULTISPECIES: hypothetical protein [unclassified Microcoleus]|uniref:hypothetical protein n=1 Tax=unclassified Microcoleus TaxID=2642155 RepID=UPI002FD34335
MAIEILPGVNALLIPKHRYLGSASGTVLVAQTGKPAIELKFKYKTSLIGDNPVDFSPQPGFLPNLSTKKGEKSFSFPPTILFASSSSSKLF